MDDLKLKSIASVAPTLRNLKELRPQLQACLLLRRLATLYASSSDTFHRHNMRMPQAMDLAYGYPDTEKLGVMDFLLARPWQELLNAGYIVERSSNGFFGITDDGYVAAADCASQSVRPPDDELPVGLAQMAEIRFRRPAAQLYEQIWESKDIKDLIAKNASANFTQEKEGYVRKAADLVLLQFKGVEKLFESAYIEGLGGLEITPSVERWLRAEAERTVQEEVARAQPVMASVLQSFTGIRTSIHGSYLARLQGEGQAMLARLNDSIVMEKFAKRETDAHRSSMPPRTTGSAKNAPMIFISHSSADEKLAAALIDLLESALPGVRSGQNRIRCTSVPGYKLEGGTETDAVLREEIRDAAVFIGLLTRNSLRSTYVLFELGARWGLQTKIKPLISGFPQSEVRAPLNRLHIQSCDDPTDLHQMLTEIGEQVGMPLSGPHVYDRHLQALVTRSRAHTPDERPYIRITSPIDKSKVPHRVYVEGDASHAMEDVWVIVHPTVSLKFWVQPQAAAKADGTWIAQAYIGREGNADIGYLYEVLAVAAPVENLSDGTTLLGWPTAKVRSQIVTLERM